jgi:hypothetical protein
MIWPIWTFGEMLASEESSLLIRFRPLTHRRIEVRLFDSARDFSTTFRRQLIISCQSDGSICLTKLADTFALSGCTVSEIQSSICTFSHHISQGDRSPKLPSPLRTQPHPPPTLYNGAYKGARLHTGDKHPQLHNLPSRVRTERCHHANHIQVDRNVWLISPRDIIYKCHCSGRPS